MQVHVYKLDELLLLVPESGTPHFFYTWRDNDVGITSLYRQDRQLTTVQPLITFAPLSTNQLLAISQQLRSSTAIALSPDCVKDLGVYNINSALDPLPSSGDDIAYLQNNLAPELERLGLITLD